MLAAVNKNKNNPGPGTHYVKDLDKRRQGIHATMGPVQQPEPLPDNGVPGPGTYEIDKPSKVNTLKMF